MTAPTWHLSLYATEFDATRLLVAENLLTGEKFKYKALVFDSREAGKAFLAGLKGKLPRDPSGSPQWWQKLTLEDLKGLFRDGSQPWEEEWEIVVNSDLRDSGRRTEDGDPIIDEVFFIQAIEVSYGRRYRHSRIFLNDRGGAEKLAAQILEALRVTRTWSATSNPHWVKDAPVYGSLAHEKLGDYHLMDEQELNAARERGALH